MPLLVRPWIFINDFFLIICPSELNHGCKSKSTFWYSFYSFLRKLLTTAVTLSTAPLKSCISFWLKILDTTFNPWLELQCPATSPSWPITGPRWSSDFTWISGITGKQSSDAMVTVDGITLVLLFWCTSVRLKLPDIRLP